MKEAEYYRKLWQCGLHDERLNHEENPVIVWQLFDDDGEKQVLEYIDDAKEAEKNLCLTVESYLNTHRKSKFRLLVLSSKSPVKNTCDYIVERFADKLSAFHWCFVALRDIQRSSCAFHADSYEHRISPKTSEDNITGLKSLVRANVKLSTFNMATWSYIRGFFQLSCVLPSCLGLTYDKTFGHRVEFPKESVVFRFSREEEDKNMADDLKQILNSKDCSENALETTSVK